MSKHNEPSSLLFDEAHTRRLSDVFAPAFTLVLQLRSAREYGDAEVLRKRVLDLLAKLDREAARSGISQEQVTDAKFAVIAFIDETILSSDWRDKERWLAKPLQLELFKRYDAGEEFFHRLEAVRENAQANAEVIEVYYLCMTLGFKGKYQLFGQEELRTIIEQTYADLSRMPGLSARALSPNGKPRDQVIQEVKTKVPPWVIALVAACIGILIYIGMSIYVTRSAEQRAGSLQELTATTTPAEQHRPSSTSA